MAADPLRLDEEEYRLVYENGYKTWSASMEQAADDPELLPASFQVEHLFPQHPYCPVGLELDGSGLLTASSTWVPGTGSCDLPSFEQPFQILPYVATPTRFFMSTKAPVPPSSWFQQYDNHLTVLVSAWAYALSARWVEIIPQASPLEYTDSQAEWVASQSYDKRNADAIVELGVVSDEAARWWAAVLSPGSCYPAIQRLEKYNAQPTTMPTLRDSSSNPVTQQQESATSISRQDEFTLAFLTQGISRYRFPPIYPYPLPGSTAINDLDLDVRLHTACPGGHGLKFSKIIWSCTGRRKEVQEAATLATIVRSRPTSPSLTAANPVDYTRLDPDRDILELATRNVFMWMREMDGFPIGEREIYQHEWFGEDDSDDDERNHPEGDVGSSMGCNLAVTVGGWVSGVMVARCNSL
ncbi:hypothetical protein NCS56_00443800 [Fusarium sp. Ph1]|nr:hypothetical protein NCS56_00443800 [Fusarium sp. Ph1]